jgi:hypothetical protein
MPRTNVAAGTDPASRSCSCGAVRSYRQTRWRQQSGTAYLFHQIEPLVVAIATALEQDPVEPDPVANHRLQWILNRGSGTLNVSSITLRNRDAHFVQQAQVALGHVKRHQHVLARQRRDSYVRTGIRVASGCTRRDRRQTKSAGNRDQYTAPGSQRQIRHVRQGRLWRRGRSGEKRCCSWLSRMNGVI